MKTTIPFRPDAKKPFTFQVTVGKTKFFGRVPYNHYSKRYYLELKDSKGNVISFTPLIASPDDHDINLALHCGEGTLIYRGSSNQFEAT